MDAGEADGEGEEDEDEDDGGRVDVGPPEAEEHADGGDLGGDGEDVAVDEVVAEGDAPGGIDEELGVADVGAGHGEQGGDLAQGELYGADDEADDAVAEEGAQRTAGLDRAAEPEEETRANGAGDAYHGEMALLEAALEAAVLLGGDDVAAGKGVILREHTGLRVAGWRLKRAWEQGIVLRGDDAIVVLNGHDAVFACRRWPTACLPLCWGRDGMLAVGRGQAMSLGL